MKYDGLQSREAIERTGSASRCGLGLYYPLRRALLGSMNDRSPSPV
jgi:hypothetical protein